MSTQSQIAQWARETFPDATIHNIIDKYTDEADELYTILYGEDEYAIADELADVAILLYQIADRCGVDLDMAVAGKFDANRARTWTRLADGTYQHVEGK